MTTFQQSNWTATIVAAGTSGTIIIILHPTVAVCLARETTVCRSSSDYSILTE